MSLRLQSFVHNAFIPLVNTEFLYLNQKQKHEILMYTDEFSVLWATVILTLVVNNRGFRLFKFKIVDDKFIVISA